MTRIPVAALSAAALLGVAACTSVAPDPDAAPGGRAGQRGSAATPALTVTPAEQLAPAFSELVSRTEPELVVAWAPIGRPDDVQVLGQGDTFDAWSTIKVPIALAAVQKAEGDLPDAARQDVAASLTHSSNEAASRLFSRLAQYGQPAAVVDEVLAASGDTNTRVSASAFGLTQWSPSDAARFAAMLPCTPFADEVLDTMEGVVADQKWGLGKLDGAVYKGGWGRSNGGYLVRQIGVVRDATGAGIGVSLQAQPQNGSHATATAELDAAATWLRQHLAPGDSAACPGASSGVATTSP